MHVTLCFSDDMLFRSPQFVWYTLSGSALLKWLAIVVDHSVNPTSNSHQWASIFKLFFFQFFLYHLENWAGSTPRSSPVLSALIPNCLGYYRLGYHAFPTKVKRAFQNFEICPPPIYLSGVKGKNRCCRLSEIDVAKEIKFYRRVFLK